jgi:hypothetical protein
VTLMSWPGRRGLPALKFSLYPSTDGEARRARELPKLRSSLPKDQVAGPRPVHGQQVRTNSAKPRSSTFGSVLANDEPPSRAVRVGFVAISDPRAIARQILGVFGGGLLNVRVGAPVDAGSEPDETRSTDTPRAVGGQS